MSILDQLSSQVGDRTEKANRKVAAECLAEPELLAEIAEGLGSSNAALVGDCAEVLTEVAAECREWVAPYAEELAELLGHKKTRVRWEATHALALVAEFASHVITDVVPQLGEMVHRDRSVIVRDYAVDAVGNYAKLGAPAAHDAYPVLAEALRAWKGKHAAHALEGLLNVVQVLPRLAAEIRALAEPFVEDRRARVRKAAEALMRATGG